MSPGVISISAEGWRKKTKSRSPDWERVTKASIVRACLENETARVSTPNPDSAAASPRPKGSSPTLPIKPASFPSRESPAATLAGAPPADGMKEGTL